uniref:UvrD-like helicase ATP-binding domain-containing protein n=1 Tax=Macrostomum lignano TaxID=282301 RepID=A0A1I8F486_9PLAT
CWKSIHVLLKCYFGSAASVNPDTNLKPTLEHGLRLYLGVHTVEAVVEDARRGNVAASARLQDLLMSGYQRGDQTKRLELVDLLRRAGALCDLSGMEMSELSSQQRQGFARDLPQLMQRGLLGPDCLGENPLYKALIVALDIEPGYFELFEHLLDLYKSDPESHPQLDPCLRDRDGNTLYHTAAATRSRHSIEAVRKIAELTDANPNLRNKARQTALQAICRSVRRRDRAQLVMQLTQAAARFPEPEPRVAYGRSGRSDDEAGVEASALMVRDGAELDWEIECTLLHGASEGCVRLFTGAAGALWLSRSACRSRPAGLGLQFYQTSLGGQASLLWERAVTFSPKRSGPQGRIYCDVLRLWAIVESSEALAEEITRAITAHKRGAACALARELNSAAAAASALASDNAANAGRILPRTYSVVSGGGGGGSSDLVRFQPPGASKETEYHMMKFYSWDASLIADILTGEARIDLPFRVTEQEHAIIELSSESPVLLIGRSGTGKTTCCVDPDAADDGAQSDEDADAADDAGDAAGGEADQRHRGRHRGRVRNRNRTTNSDATDTYEEEAAAVASSAVDVGSDNEDAPEPQFDHLRQLFVTKNPVLCRESAKTSTICAPACGTPSCRSRSSNCQTGCRWPIPVISPCLSAPSSCGCCWTPVCPVSRSFSATRTQSGQEGAGWEDEEADIEFLLDSTADDLFDAANYYDDGNADGGGVEGGADVAGAGGANADQQNPAPQQLEDRRREVTYEFLWEKLPSKLRSGLQPSLVWTELVSFIKGSVEALNSPGGFLSLAKYRELGKKRAPEFADSRERVYRLFEEYQRPAA